MKGEAILGALAGLAEVTGSHLAIFFLSMKYLERKVVPIVEYCAEQCKNASDFNQCVDQCLDNHKDKIFHAIATFLIINGTGFEANDFINYVLIDKVRRVGSEFKGAYKGIMVLSGVIDTLITAFSYRAAWALIESAKRKVLGRYLGGKVNIPHMRLM